MIHMTLQQLSAYLDGELTESSAELVRRHLSQCSDCTVRFAGVEAQEELLTELLQYDPGDGFFDRFRDEITFGEGSHARPSAAKSKSNRRPKTETVARAKRNVAAPDRLAERARNATPPPAPERLPEPTQAAPPAPVVPAAQLDPRTPAAEAIPAPTPPPVPAHASAPNGLEIVRISEDRRTLEVVVPAAPAAAPVTTPVSPVLYGRRDEDRRAEPTRYGAAAGWIAAAVVTVIALSLAVVATRTRPVAPPSMAQAPSPEALLERSALPAVERNDAAPVVPDVEIDRAPEPDAPSVAIAEPPRRAVIAEEDPPPPEPAPQLSPPIAKPEERPMPPKPSAPVSERLVDRAPQNVVPVRTIVTRSSLVPPPTTDPAPEQPATTRRGGANGAGAAPDPATTTARAKKLSLEAAGTRDAAAYDAAASAWAEALPRLGDSPEDEAVARRELAQARFQAWALAASPARREAAVKAARAYLLYAPPGPDRDQAWTWLGRLKH